MNELNLQVNLERERESPDGTARGMRARPAAMYSELQYVTHDYHPNRGSQRDANEKERAQALKCVPAHKSRVSKTRIKWQFKHKDFDNDKRTETFKNMSLQSPCCSEGL
jgi:hypothetical protein